MKCMILRWFFSKELEINVNAVIPRDVSRYGIVAGNPAKVIKIRFDQETILAIEKIAWWRKNKHEIANFFSDKRDAFFNPKEMLK